MPNISSHRFLQVDVFSQQSLMGNPLAVIANADDLSDATMAALARWTNLSETTFLLRPTDPSADYRLRIFTPQQELPFAGHPTLGSAHAWLACNGTPVAPGREIIQQCAAGLIRIRRDGDRLAFAAPGLKRQGPVEPELLQTICNGLSLHPRDIIAHNWVDNGPGWLAIMISSRSMLLALKPDFRLLSGLRVGVIAPADAQLCDAQFEVRAFTAAGIEDPVTGSLNAGIAQWLIGSGIAAPHYVAAQGTILGRAGRIHIDRHGDDIWVGGAVVTTIAGQVQLPISG